MNTLSLRVRYRPVRLGFCIEKGNIDDLQNALRLMHTLWGGRFNPLIPVGTGIQDNDLTTSLVDIFQVDALYPVRDAELLETFVKGFPYLIWPDFTRELFTKGAWGTVAEFLDIYHPVRSIFDEHVRDKTQPRVSSTLFEWAEDDPLRNVFLTLFGGYPSVEKVGKDYADFVLKNLGGERAQLKAAEAIPADAYTKLTPAVLSAWELEQEIRSFHHQPGFYVGSASDFDDLVNCWNLRAAGIDLVFYDHAHEVRFGNLKAACLESLGKRRADSAGWRDRVAVWAKAPDVLRTVDFGQNSLGNVVTTGIWNGLNVIPDDVYLDDNSVLASVDENRTNTPTVSFQLPVKPFFVEPEFHNQKVVVSLRPVLDLPEISECTVKPPYIPELNEYYGREAHFVRNEARSEREGLGIITNVTKDQLTIRALLTRELISKLFESFGMKAEPSRAGLVASRLIAQMGGLQGCRVFKIAGVRKLIEKYGPLESFTRSGAIQVIGQNDPRTGQPQFGSYEDLFIEQRQEPKLKAENAFEFLVKHGVFQVGLKLKCPNCQLDFWIFLDDVATEVRCGLCGRVFNITGQLRDRDWAYRRSGLFGREDHQEGSIPVALTLQQIDTTLSRNLLYSTAMNIIPNNRTIAPCETDFVLIGEQNSE